jgi:hypothetical protein
VNRSEIEEHLKVLRKRVELIDADLAKFPADLSAVSQVAMIGAKVGFEFDIKKFEAMLDMLEFEEITKDF